jgi:adenine-specific DNA-methyltransferase
VPHVTLKSIAQNAHLDPIFARREPILDEALAKCNAALTSVTDEVRRRLAVKLIDKQRRQGKRAVTDADRRRWDLPKNQPQMNTDEHRSKQDNLCSSVFICGFSHWTVPFDTDPDWPKQLQQAVTAYRKAWRAKMDEVNDCIAKNAEQEKLVDQPETVRGVVRVSGPFTMEVVQPPEVSLGDAIDHVGEPEEVGPTFEVREARLGDSPENVEAYLERMVRLLRTDGVRFLDNKQMRFTRLEGVYTAGQASGFHAEGRWVLEGETDPEPDGPATVGVVFSPQFGPVTEKMIEGLIKPASRRYDALLFAAFSFTAEAQALIAENAHPNLRLHLFLIRPDVGPGMDGLLKEQAGGHVFTALDLPRTRVEGPDENGDYCVVMEGMDVYNPVDNSITPTRADKVAAWFLDADYDEKGTFCVSQAFFPDSSWAKLSKALSGVVDATAFAQFSGTRSLPFKRGGRGKVAVKVIDPRGNEAMRVHELATDEHG